MDSFIDYSTFVFPNTGQVKGEWGIMILHNLMMMIAFFTLKVFEYP